MANKKPWEEEPNSRYRPDTLRLAGRNDAAYQTEKLANEVYDLGYDEGKAANQAAVDKAVANAASNNVVPTNAKPTVNPTVRATAQEAVANKPLVSEDIMNDILNRKQFSYNPNADALYQIYKDQYLTAGNIAMKDTMGKAAALTGGYGNTYAQTVGQQVYDDYAARAADKIPELEQLAYERWAREGDELRNNYNLLYGREQDQATAEWRQKEWDLQLERYRVADEQWAAQHGLDVAKFEESKYEFQENLALEWANMDLKQKELALDKWYKEQGIKLSQAELAEKARQFDSEMNYKYYAEGNDIAYKYAALAQDQAQHNEDMSYKYASLNKTSGNGGGTTPADGVSEAYKAKFTGSVKLDSDEKWNSIINKTAVAIKNGTFDESSLYKYTYEQATAIFDRAEALVRGADKTRTNKISAGTK